MPEKSDYSICKKHDVSTSGGLAKFVSCVQTQTGTFKQLHEVLRDVNEQCKQRQRDQAMVNAVFNQSK